MTSSKTFYQLEIVSKEFKKIILSSKSVTTGKVMQPIKIVVGIESKTLRATAV